MPASGSEQKADFRSEISHFKRKANWRSLGRFRANARNSSVRWGPGIASEGFDVARITEGEDHAGRDLAMTSAPISAAANDTEEAITNIKFEISDDAQRFSL